MIQYICGLAVLSGLAVIDIKRKSLPVYLIIATAILSVRARILWGENLNFPEIIGAVIFLWMLHMTKAGSADVAIIGCLWIWQGLFKTVLAVWCGFVVCGLLGVMLILAHRATKRTRLPFIPFLTLGYCMQIFF